MKEMCCKQLIHVSCDSVFGLELLRETSELKVQISDQSRERAGSWRQVRRRERERVEEVKRGNRKNI